MNIKHTLTTMLPLKKTAFLLSAAVLMICTAATVNAQNANLSGEWNLNEGKSELGQFGGRMAPKKLKIEGQADAISFERFSTNQNGEAVTTKDKLSFDGKETESTVWGNSKKKSTAKWAADGKSLNVNSTIMLDRNGEMTEIKVAEVWKLSDDGQSLTLESTSNSSFGTNTMKLVYDKAK
jgi:hypothetical protein